MARKFSNEAKLGLLAIVTLTVLIWGYRFLKGKNLLDNSNTYYITYSDVGGLNTSAPVFINGFQVGSVTAVKLKPDDVEKINVTIEVDGEIELPKTTTAVLASSSIMGGKSILLEYGNADMQNGILENKSYIDGTTQGLLGSMVDVNEVDVYFDKLKNGFSGLIDTITQSSPNAEESIMQSIEEFQTTIKNLSGISNKINIMLAKSASNFDETLSNVASLSETLKNSNAKIAGIIDNLDVVTTDLKNAEISKTVGAAEGAITEVKTSLTTIQGTVKSAEEAIANINQLISKVENGDGSLSALINDKALYNNLESTSQNLDLLLQDFRLNPKRYVNVSVFGKKDKEYVVPEDDPAEKIKDSKN
ncbi:MlaD family protein [Portibacter lacus]|uniref:Organic solvent ABC transporter substrate-binding protein n=1 Tax=Portibacter lacus TaxID=1099794 RepID=A0AA37WF14_9BACT|nr:MlaD family protein [Portibacter lacus]GLR18373.1 organic solvent ABC transporter substrate-binding protein [Portibacter lacus]